MDVNELVAIYVIGNANQNRILISTNERLDRELMKYRCMVPDFSLLWMSSIIPFIDAHYITQITYSELQLYKIRLDSSSDYWLDSNSNLTIKTLVDTIANYSRDITFSIEPIRKHVPTQFKLEALVNKSA